MKLILTNTLTITPKEIALLIKKLKNYSQARRETILYLFSESYFFMCEYVKENIQKRKRNKKVKNDFKGDTLKRYQLYRMKLHHNIDMLLKHNIITIEIKNNNKLVSFNNDIESWSDISYFGSKTKKINPL